MNVEHQMEEPLQGPAEDQSSVFLIDSPDGSLLEGRTEALQTNRPPIPVGITIAYKQQQGLQRETPIPPSTTKQHHTEQHPSQPSTPWQVFMDSALIYAVCLILPSAFGYAYQWWYTGIWQTPQPIVAPNTLEWYLATLSHPESSMCKSYDDSDTTATNSLWGYISYVSNSMGWCQLANPSAHIYSNDIFAWSDSFSITIFSLMITIVRMAIVHWYVSIETATEFAAMVRCKSMHLLSSDYIVTPIATPIPRRRTIVQHTNAAAPELVLPNLNDTNRSATAAPSSYVQLEPIGTGMPNHTENSKEADFNEQLMTKLTEATVSSSNRIYAGPRYATALFRLSYSASAVLIALYFFRTADFWPWYVFGNGDSSQCWDLSGGLAVAMDSDFDQRNGYLKQYFLWQASYHWHSAAFHILSMLILVLHPTKHAPHRFMSLQKGTTMYIRRLFQHALAVALIGIAYIFSSLRRLGAIGLFAFDVSSCCLHLLQLCINAPESSRLSRIPTIAGVFWILVVPTFVLARFAIWPAIWYSAAFESGAWLQQLEKTLWPGSAATILYAIHFLMAALEILSLIYFQRLFNHAHVKRVLLQRLGGGVDNSSSDVTTAKLGKKMAATCDS